MKTNVLVAACVLAGGGFVSGSCVAAETVSAQRSVEKSAAGRPRLQPGMSADTVVSLVGRPNAINSIKTAQGQGERWTYRRVLGQNTSLDPVTIQAVPIFDGTVGRTSDIGTEMAPVFHVNNVVVYQVTALLMVDGKLVMAKQWQERSRDYAD